MLLRVDIVGSSKNGASDTSSSMRLASVGEDDRDGDGDEADEVE